MASLTADAIVCAVRAHGEHGAILRALTLNWEYLGPFERKQRLCDVSLRWLFTTLKSQVDFHHRNKSSDWDRWNEGWTLALHRQTAERCVQLGVLLDDVLVLGEVDAEGLVGGDEALAGAELGDPASSF